MSKTNCTSMSKSNPSGFRQIILLSAYNVSTFFKSVEDSATDHYAQMSIHRKYIFGMREKLQTAGLYGDGYDDIMLCL